MPPEPVPWDRRDFRKYERSSSDLRFGAGNYDGGGGPHRWREQDHHPHPPPHHHQNRHQQQQQRWNSDFCSSRPIPPGHGKQAGWHMNPDEPYNRFVPFESRYDDRNYEDENCRSFGSRGGDRRYFRNIRENRGSFTLKDWKAPSWELHATLSGPGRPSTNINHHRSLQNTQSSHNNNSGKSIGSTTHPPDSSDPFGQSQTLLKEKHDNKVGTPDGPASTCEKIEKESAGKENGLGSTDWKPLKWTRSGSLSSRSSSFNHSSSSKSMGVDSIETVTERQPKNVTPLQSPSADAATCVMSGEPALSDEDRSRKKPRLGWGEGLAKYENKKDESPEDSPIKHGLVISVSDTETVQCHSVCLRDKSPKVITLPGDASLATPSSVACIFSPANKKQENGIHHATETVQRQAVCLLDKRPKVASFPGYDSPATPFSVACSSSPGNLSCSPSIMSHKHYCGPTLNLENLEVSSITNLSNLINELLQSNDPRSAEVGYVHTSSMNKLLVWKVELLKAVEITESEVDSLETELKSLKPEVRSCSPHPVSSSSLPEDCHSKPCKDQVTASKFTFRPTPLQVVSSGDMIVQNTPVAPENKHSMLKDMDFYSPGSATSKVIDVLPACNGSLISDEKCFENPLSDEENNVKVHNYKLSLINSSQDLACHGNLHPDIYDTYTSILVTNKDYFNRALEALNKLLPAKECQFDASNVLTVSSLCMDFSAVKEKYLRRKRLLQFQEKVNALKFKVFQHFWKEGRLLSVRKLRIKSQRKFDLSRSRHKRNHSSSHSRTSSSGGSRAVTADEVIEFVNGLFSEMPPKPCRNTLKMPALILDKKMKMSRFISNNGLVEDPCAAEKERSMINQWTSEETEFFIDKLATFGKDFKKIASFMDSKTIAGCVEFYYKNHKSECFQKARDLMKQRKPQSTTYLVPSEKLWNHDTNAASLDMLGATSAIVANIDNSTEIPQKCTSRFLYGPFNSQRTSRVDNGSPLQRTDSLDMYSNEREMAAAEMLAGICGSISSEAMSSCITSSFEPGEGNHDWMCQRVGSTSKKPLTIEVTQNIEDGYSDESCAELDPTDWTDEEKSIFIQAVSSYGKNFVMISQSVRTKSRDQCKVFFGKTRKCLGLDLILPGATNGGDIHGGGSDTEDACDVETGSVICSDGSECKIEDDIAQNLNHDLKMFEENSGLLPFDSMAVKPVLMNSPNQPCQTDKPVSDFKTENEEQDNVNSACLPVQEPGTMGVSSNTDGIHVKKEGQEIVCRLEETTLTRVSHGDEGRGILSPEYNLVNEKVENGDVNSNEVGGLDCAVSEMKSNQVVSHLSVDAHSSMQVDGVSGFQKKADFECRCVENPFAIPLQQNGYLASLKSSTLFSVPIEFRGRKTQNDSSVSGTDKHSQKVVRTFDSQPHLPSHSSSDPVQTMKEITRDVSCKGSVPFQNVQKWDGILHSDQCADFLLHKCSGLKLESKAVEDRFPFQEQNRDNSSPKSAPSSRNGDLKLFGQILVPSQHKPNSFAQEIISDNNNNNSEHHKLSSCSVNLKFNGDRKVILDSAQSKFGCSSNSISSENVPVNKSCGFWDGNRIQIGFSPLPDSTLLLTKYPDAFSNYSMPTIKLDGVVSSSGVSVFPSSSSNEVAEYLRKREVHPFTIDMKQSQDALVSEMQRRNGLLQHQGLGVVGMNVGRNGVFGVADPVAAIKMHYANNAEQFGVQIGNIMKQNDTLRSNGDVGR